MKWRMERRCTFNAAHHLPGTGTPCERVHGHNWVVWLIAEGDTLDAQGMLMPFERLKEFQTWLDRNVDHRSLNDLPVFATMPPTTENVAAVMLDTAQVMIGRMVVAVRVHETENNVVTYGDF